MIESDFRRRLLILENRVERLEAEPHRGVAAELGSRIAGLSMPSRFNRTRKRQVVGPESAVWNRDVLIKLVNIHGVPISNAKLRLSVGVWPTESHTDTVFGGGPEEDLDDYNTPETSEYAIHLRDTSVSGSDGVAGYQLQEFSGPKEPGAVSENLRELLGTHENLPTIGLKFTGYIININTPGYLGFPFTSYGGVSARAYDLGCISGPPSPDPENPGDTITTSVVAGTLCTVTASITPGTSFLSYSFAPNLVPQRRLTCSEQHESGYLQGVYRTRGAWRIQCILTSTSDGLGGYKLNVVTTNLLGGLITSETFDTVSRGLSGGKVELVYNVTGSTAASRIFPTGSAIITLTEA